ncbi:MAG TPA: CHAT domain-containing tetratricopeptide repeat protein [Thermoanaerobaculia bacterium]
MALRPPLQGHAFVVTLQPGEFLALTFEQKRLDVVVKVFGPSGEPVFTVDGLNGDLGPELVPLLSEEGGRYRIEVSGKGEGTYQVTAGTKRQAQQKEWDQTTAAAAFSRGMALKQSRKLTEAERQLADATSRWKTGGYPLGQADSGYQLGQVRISMKKWAEAREPLEKALTIYRQLKSPVLEGYVLNELGLVSSELDRSAQALELYEQSLAIAQRHRLAELEINVLRNWAILDQEIGEFGRALRQAERGLSLAATSGTVEQQVTLNNVLGRIHKSLGDPRNALKFHGKALELVRRHPNPELSAATAVHFGDAYKELGDWDRAIRNYSRAISLWQEIGDLAEEATALNNLAVTNLRMKRWKEARDILQRVRRIHQYLGKRNDAAVAAINLGWVSTSMGRYDEALRMQGEALKMVEGQGFRPTEAAAYFGMATAERKRGNLLTARRHLEKALEIMETIRVKAERRRLQTLFLAGRQNFYDLLVDILMEQDRRQPAKGYDVQAFEASERARCRTLLEALEGKIVLPAYSARELQKELDQDTILLEYFLASKKSFLWVVTPESITSYDLPPRERIEKLAMEAHRLLAASDKLENQALAVRRATELSQVLLGPVARRLDRKRLLIVAPPELQYIPFGALPRLGGPAARPGEWPMPWLERFEVVMEPSATFLASLRKLRKNRQPSSGTLALIADPMFPVSRAGERQTGNKPRFSRLRHSRDEAAAIGGQANGRVTSYLGFDANRSVVLNGEVNSHGILHFSAHGALVEENPGASAIVLSAVDRNGGPVESHLRASDIATLDLSADLVVLSACSTGLGTRIPGEGLVGLTQAFFSAGASSVAASLWNVDDLGTSELMRSFYRNLLLKKLPPSVALREAQLSMWKQTRWRAPYYWAGFVLQGEWR